MIHADELLEHAIVGREIDDAHVLQISLIMPVIAGGGGLAYLDDLQVVNRVAPNRLQVARQEILLQFLVERALEDPETNNYDLLASPIATSGGCRGASWRRRLPSTASGVLAA